MIGGAVTSTLIDRNPSALDNIAQVTDALKHATKYTYDKNGNLTNKTSVTDPLGARTAYIYDANSNLHRDGCSWWHYKVRL